jgi:acyl carrier protein
MKNNLIVEIISRNLDLNIKEIDLEMDLCKYDNWSSLTKLYIVSDIEEELDVQFNVDEIENAKSIADFIYLIGLKRN